MKTEIISVTVNSQQVSEAIKGLHSALLPNRNAPTGQVMTLFIRLMDDVGQQKYEKCMTEHLAIVENERTIYKRTGFSLSATL